jgi:hypothetical protein
MKRFLGYIIKKAAGKGKVSPTIKSVKPTTDVKGSVKRVYRDEGSKRMDATIASKNKMKKGKQMMREGQKELRRQIDTGRAFKFKNQKIGESTFAIKPGDRPRKDFKGLTEERNKASKKMFKTGKQLEAEKKAREKKMGGGMMGRRFGMEEGGKAKKPFKLTKENAKKIVEADKKRLEKTGRKREMYKKGSKFPDLTGDGKVTFADILKGRGVINGKKKKNGSIYLSKKK